MKFVVAILIIVSAVKALALNPSEMENKSAEIATSLTDSLVLQQPVILDIRCGEWTSYLEREMSKALLARKVDLRETNIMLIKDNNDMLPIAMESDFGVNGKILLEMLKLRNADLLEVSLEQSIETGEKKTFFSYTRYNIPVYRFTLKQIALPEQKIVFIKETKESGTVEPDNPSSLLAAKWYEPVIASAILGSLIYLLWTVK